MNACQGNLTYTSHNPPTQPELAHLTLENRTCGPSKEIPDLLANHALSPYWLFQHCVKLTLAENPLGKNAAVLLKTALSHACSYFLLTKGHQTPHSIVLVLSLDTRLVLKCGLTPHAFGLGFTGLVPPQGPQELPR